MKENYKRNRVKSQKNDYQNKIFKLSKNDDYFKEYSDDFSDSISINRKIKSPEENDVKFNLLNNKEKLIYSKISTSASNKKNVYESNEEKEKYIKKIKEKKLKFYEDEEKTNNNEFNKEKSKTTFKIDDKNNNDLIYLLNTSKNEDESETDYSERIKFNIALPFCHYHKYNIKLPKKYTCNFKNCSCCGFMETKRAPYLDNNTHYKNKGGDYIYPNIKSEKKESKYRSVLDQFKNKKKNNIIKVNKTIISDSSESNQISDFNFNFLKPNNEIIKIPKNDFISENEFENSNDDTISSKLELPGDCNINDGNDLKRFRNLVNNDEKKSKIHLSVLYYKKLNKSYNQIYSKDIKKEDNNHIKGVNKKKNIEYLRE